MKKNRLDDILNEKGHLNKYLIPYGPLFMLIFIIGVISYFRVLIQIDIGPLSDTCDFLLNGLYFSGQGVGYYDWSRPPFFPFIVALPLFLGFVSLTTMYVVDAVMFVIGLFGFYLLLNLHFTRIESFFGGLLFATFPVIILLLGLGFSDFTCLTLLIWAFYFLVLAKKDSRYFIISLPIFMMAFLTRYNVALVIFPIILYLLINKEKMTNFRLILKNILLGCLVSFLVILPVLIFFYQKLGSILYPFQSTFGNTATSSFLPEYYPYDPNLFYFIDKFFIFTGFEGLLIVLIVTMGLLALLLLKIKNKSLNKYVKSFNEYKTHTKKFYFKSVFFMALLVSFILSFGQLHYIFSEILFFLVLLSFYMLVKNLNIRGLDLHLLVFSWLMVFFIFNSIFVIKSDRYFILMAPPAAYFMLLGLTIISERISLTFKNKNISFPLIALILTVLILFSTAISLPVIANDNQDYKYSNEQITIASEWFINYDPDYKNKIIYSDLWPYLAWSLKMDIKMMSIFKDNQVYGGGVKNSTFTPEDSKAFNNFLINNNADYYFCVQNINLTSYRAIKQFGSLIIYEKIG